MNQSIESQMIDVFLEEALESLSLWETTCLKIDTGDKDALFTQLFRIAHNLKGSSLSVGLQELGDSIHKVEELMTLLRNKKIEFTNNILNIFFEFHSLMSEWTNNLRENHSYKNENKAEFLEKVISAMEKQNKKEEETPQAFCIWDEPVPSTQPKKIENNKETNPEQKPSEVKKTSTPNQEEGKKPVEQKISKPKPQDEYIRVHVNKLDLLINYIGEIVVDQNIMKQKSMTNSVPKDISSVISQMGKNILELQNIAMSLRMMPLEQQFQKMHRIVRDLSQRQEKNIVFESIGEDVEMPVKC